MAKKNTEGEDKVDKLLGLIVFLLFAASVVLILVSSVGSLSKLMFDMLVPEGP